MSIFKSNSACLFTVLATKHCTPPIAKQMIQITHPYFFDQTTNAIFFHFIHYVNKTG
ncbi:hypothetical protein B4147_3794 [Bacillus wiedmannii]|uniref:Uncharacterized protein n=1 Tax=Bacillus wiedmannii TaxID=1890302 RepID=A0A0G8CHJ0_9BACI|nr:hypothetical protein B4147_3794 [Bacillus wiedmannii]